MKKLIARLRLSFTPITDLALCKCGFGMYENEFTMGDLTIYNIEGKYYFYVCHGGTSKITNMQQVSNLIYGKTLYYGG